MWSVVRYILTCSDETGFWCGLRRMDTTLVDFNDMKWERGDITFIFSGDKPPTKSLVVLDNKLKVYQRVRYEVQYTVQHTEVCQLLQDNLWETPGVGQGCLVVLDNKLKVYQRVRYEVQYTVQHTEVCQLLQDNLWETPGVGQGCLIVLDNKLSTRVRYEVQYTVQHTEDCQLLQANLGRRLV